jgi:hypothetical protein
MVGSLASSARPEQLHKISKRRVLLKNYARDATPPLTSKSIVIETKEIMDKAEQLKLIKKWKTDNDVYLNNVFGMEDGPQFFVSDGHTLCYIKQQASSSTSPRCDSS